jgi:hypothetical protein
MVTGTLSREELLDCSKNVSDSPHIIDSPQTIDSPHDRLQTSKFSLAAAKLAKA